MSRSVFLSRPATLNEHQRSTFRTWCSALARRDVELRTLERAEYTPDPWGLLRHRLQDVQGAVVFGFRRWTSPSPVSPWMQLEAGLAISLDLPILALAERGVCEGVFDPTTWGSQVIGHHLSDEPAEWAIDEFLAAVQRPFSRASGDRVGHEMHEEGHAVVTTRAC